jgi:hypothetical protein
MGNEASQHATGLDQEANEIKNEGKNKNQIKNTNREESGIAEVAR